MNHNLPKHNSRNGTGKLLVSTEHTQIDRYLFMEVTLNYCHAQQRFMRVTISKYRPRSEVVQLHFCPDDRYNVQLIISF